MYCCMCVSYPHQRAGDEATGVATLNGDAGMGENGQPDLTEETTAIQGNMARIRTLIILNLMRTDLTVGKNPAGTSLDD
jgi:hypothetical protein